VFTTFTMRLGPRLGEGMSERPLLFSKLCQKCK